MGDGSAPNSIYSNPMSSNYSKRLEYHNEFLNITMITLGGMKAILQYHFSYFSLEVRIRICRQILLTLLKATLLMRSHACVLCSVLFIFSNGKIWNANDSVQILTHIIANPRVKEIVFNSRYYCLLARYSHDIYVYLHKFFTKICLLLCVLLVKTGTFSELSVPLPVSKSSTNWTRTR